MPGGVVAVSRQCQQLHSYDARVRAGPGVAALRDPHVVRHGLVHRWSRQQNACGRNGSAGTTSCLFKGCRQPDQGSQNENCKPLLAKCLQLGAVNDNAVPGKDTG